MWLKDDSAVETLKPLLRLVQRTKAAIQKRKGVAVRSGVCSWKTETTDILTPSLHRRCPVIQKRGETSAQYYPDP